MYIPKLLKYSLTFAAQDFQALDYFTQYSNSSSVTTDLPNFGLKSEHSWSSFLQDIQDLNDKSDDTRYKLIFLARHGEAWHNVLGSLPNWDEISRQDTYKNYTLFDDDLTPTGESQISKVHDYWINELNNGAPYPQVFYTSPLRRTLHTYHITWGVQNGSAIVVENLRERYGIETPEERHNKTWISDYCKDCEFEKGLAQDDELWKQDEQESKKHVRKRAKEWMQSLFARDEHIISVTSHSGTIKQILKVIGHPKHSLQPGELIPVVVKGRKSHN